MQPSPVSVAIARSSASRSRRRRFGAAFAQVPSPDDLGPALRGDLVRRRPRGGDRVRAGSQPARPSPTSAPRRRRRTGSIPSRDMSDERPLRLDAPREEALEHAARLVAEAWRSFDRFRPEEPALDERRAAGCSSVALPDEASPVHDALDDAARILDESIAQARPRYFAFIGSSGLEIGTIGDFLAHSYDINLAVDARAATQIEDQAVRWVSEFVGFPDGCGCVHERRYRQQRDGDRGRAGAGGARKPPRRARSDAHGASTAPRRCTTRSPERCELLGIGSDNLRAIEIDGLRRMRPEALDDAIAHDLAAGVMPVAVVATAGTTLTGGIDPLDASGPGVRGARRLDARRRRVRPAGRVGLLEARPVHGARSRRLVLDRRAQVALPAEGVRRRARARRRKRSPARSATSRAICRTSSTSCTRPTSRSSTRGRSER